MSSKAVATVEAPAVPALAPTPATTITAEDIAIPRLYVGNYMSEAVKHQLVKFGDVYLATSADDSEPQTLWSLGDEPESGVLAYVLHLRKGKSFSEKGSGSPLQVWDFDDPSADPRAWTTYQYTLFLPEVDPDLPARMLLTKTGKPVAQKINTVLARASGQGPSWLHAFRITSAKRQRDTNEWAIFQASLTTADPDHVRQAGELFSLIAPSLQSGRSNTTTTGSDEPDI